MEEYNELLRKAINLSEDEQIMIMLGLMGNVISASKTYIKGVSNHSVSEGIIVSPCVIIKAIMDSEKFISSLEQIYELEEKQIRNEEISSSCYTLLR